MSFKSILKKCLTVTTAAVTMASFSAAVPIAETVTAASTCVVDLSKSYQTITGFGGINHPEWTGSDLTAAQRQKAFGNGADELGFTVLRVFVNPDSTKWNLAVPTAKYASEKGVTVFASPWEPPANLAESGGSNGKLHLPKSNYAAYAKHLNDFGTYMKNNGVDLYSISVQNEPDYASEWTYWSTDETTDFLANYADKITSTRVMSPESFQYAPENASWVKDGGKKFYTKILNNAKAFANCDLFGTHFYGTARDWMDFPALEKSGKQIWMTEVYVPNSEANSNERWPESIQVAENIHNGLTVGNMSAYVWWYIRRSYGPMNENGTISKRGYCMAQYSKFVRPGYVRTEVTEQPNKDVYVSAYKGGDDKVVIVAVNKSSTEYTQEFSLGSAGIKNVDRYRTSASENLALTKNMENSGGKFYSQLPANSVSTYVVTVSDTSSIPDAGNDPTKPTPIEPNEYGWYFDHGFENDVCGWVARGASTIAQSSDEHYTKYGSKSLYVSGRTSAWNGAAYELDPATFKPGSSYSFSAHVKYKTGAESTKFQLKLEYKDSSGETQYSEIASSYAVPDKWVQLSNKSYKIPVGATNCKIYVETDEALVSFYMDEVIAAVDGTSVTGEGAMSESDIGGSDPGTDNPGTDNPGTDKPGTDKDKYVKGDLDGDGIVNVIDLCLLKQGINKGSLDVKKTPAADVDRSGTIDSSDVKYLQQYIVKKLTAFPDNAPEEPEEEKTAASTMSMSEYTAMVQKNVVEFEPAASHNEQAGVTYGTIKKDTYFSTTCNRNKPVNVLLPANYDPSKKYPVLYVMHGYWESQDRMIIKGNDTMYTRQIIGNAIAAGEAKDMIVVFPYIYSSATQENCTAMDDANNAAYDNFINDLTKDLMPYIEKTYSVKTGRDNTAITGFSMGGRESLLIGMKRSDLFGYIGAICPAPGVTGAFKWNSDAEAPHLLFITAGSNDEVVFDTPRPYHENFEKNNVPHIWHYVNGGYHGDNSIHAHIYNFVRGIFK